MGKTIGHLGLWEYWCCTSQVLDRHVQIWDHAASPAGSWFLIENWWDAYACIFMYLCDFMCIYQKYYQKYKYIYLKRCNANFGSPLLAWNGVSISRFSSEPPGLQSLKARLHLDTCSDVVSFHLADKNSNSQNHKVLVQKGNLKRFVCDDEFLSLVKF